MGLEVELFLKIDRLIRAIKTFQNALEQMEQTLKERAVELNISRKEFFEMFDDTTIFEKAIKPAWGTLSDKNITRKTLKRTKKENSDDERQDNRFSGIKPEKRTYRKRI